MSIFFLLNSLFLFANPPIFDIVLHVKHALKYILKLFAKALAIFFTVATLALILISFIHPEWIKNGVTWIGELIKVLGNWNYLIAFLSACIESLPIIGTALPGMNVMILV